MCEVCSVARICAHQAQATHGVKLGPGHTVCLGSAVCWTEAGAISTSFRGWMQCMFVARVQTAQTPAPTVLRDSGSRGDGQAQRVIGRSVEHGTLLWLDRNIGEGNLWHGSELLLVPGHKRLREPQRENAGWVDQFRRTSRDLTHAECASGRLSRRSWIGARFRHHPRQFEDPTLLGDLCTFAERWNSKATLGRQLRDGFQEPKSPNAGNVQRVKWEMSKLRTHAAKVCVEGFGKDEAEAVTAPRHELQSENAGAAALRSAGTNRVPHKSVGDGD